jgi:hypothetical protein
MKLIFWWVFYVIVATLWFIKLGPNQNHEATATHF